MLCLCLLKITYTILSYLVKATNSFLASLFKDFGVGCSHGGFYLKHLVMNHESCLILDKHVFSFMFC